MTEEYDQRMNLPALLTITAIFVILVLVSVVGTQAYFNYEKRRIHWRRVVEVPNDKLIQMNQQQLEQINEPPRWIDQENGVVSIPINRAMQLFVDRHSGP